MAIERALRKIRVNLLSRRLAAFVTLLLLCFPPLRSAAGGGYRLLEWDRRVHQSDSHRGKSQGQTRDFLIPADFDNVRSGSTAKKSSLDHIKPGAFVTGNFAQRALFGSTSVTQIAIGSALGFQPPISNGVGKAAAAAPQTAGTITLYADKGFNGPSIQLGLAANDLHVLSFARRTSTFIVASGTWRLCDQPNFGGRCITVGPGHYAQGYGGNFARSVVRWNRLRRSLPAHHPPHSLR